jgi:hypothetical protein
LVVCAALSDPAKSTKVNVLYLSISYKTVCDLVEFSLAPVGSLALLLFPYFIY